MIRGEQADRRAASPDLHLRVASLVAFVGCVAVLLANASRFYPFVSDDTFISLRYARRLLDGHGLTWTDGVPVEGYSNLAWVLLSALVGAAGVDLLVAVRVLGLVFMAATVAALLYVGRHTWGGTFAAGVAGLAFVTSATIGVWTVGGLEQPLVLACLAWAVALLVEVQARPHARHLVWLAGIALGVGSITRPDGPLFCVVLGLAFLVERGRATGWRDALVDLLRLAAPSLFLYGGQLIFRRGYYGEWVPNTALVKVAFTDERLGAGVRYVREFLHDTRPLLVVAALSALAGLARARTRYLTFLALAAGLVWTAYVVFVGGDIFPGYRHAAVVVLVCALCIGAGFAALLDPGPRLRTARWAVGIASAVVALYLFGSEYQRALTQRAHRNAVTERWELDGEVLGLALASAFGEASPTVAVTAAGCIPYYSGLPAIDMLGLNDHWLPRHPPEGFGRGPLGHELGDGDYVLGRDPELIVFWIGHPPVFRAGAVLDADPRFHERYDPVPFQIAGERPVAGRIYARIGAARLGVERGAARWSVPGFYVRAPGPTTWSPGRARFERRLPPRGLGVLRLHPDVPDGLHRVRVISNPPDQVEGMRRGRVVHLASRAEATVLIERVELLPAEQESPGEPAK